MEASAGEAEPSVATGPLGDWLAEVTGEAGPFTLQRLSGGNSNETVLVSSEQGKRVLRRQPAATLDASAHDFEREYRMLVALHGTTVPVPRPIGCARLEDRPILLMDHLDGVSLTTELPAAFPEDAVETVGYATVEALADLHSLPWREIGLEGYGRPEQFLERQVRRWRRQYDAVRHRDLPDFEVVATWLEEHRPEPGESGILHGDFHVDNCLFSPTAPVKLLAVIDWEMSTIGDPLLDVGLMLGLWGNERLTPRAMPKVQGFSHTPQAPTRAQLAARYEERSGRSLEHLDYYMVLALWKLAAIVEGAHLHYTNGKLQTAYAEALTFDVPQLFAEARAIAEGT